MLQLVGSEGLGEDVGNLLINLNIPEFDFTPQDPLMHKVIMHLDVLCASMENGVLGQLQVANIVVVDRNRSGYFVS